MMNCRKKSANGTPMIHFFGFRPTTRFHLYYLRSHSWHISRKYLNPLTMSDFLDWDFGIMAMHGRLQIELADYKRKSIEIQNLVHSASLKQNAEILTSRMGPPHPNASQVNEIQHNVHNDTHFSLSYVPLTLATLPTPLPTLSFLGRCNGNVLLSHKRKC